MKKLTIKEIAVFGMLGGVMYASKVLMDVFPNIHLIGMFIVAITAVYREKALYPLYVFVFIAGLFNGFNMWWIPYLYIWLPLWAATMLLPRKLTARRAVIIYCIVCGLHGFLYGTLYAPFQAIAFGLGFKGMLAWIVAGLPFDVVHGLSNLVIGLLIVPMIKLLKSCERIISM